MLWLKLWNKIWEKCTKQRQKWDGQFGFISRSKGQTLVSDKTKKIEYTIIKSMQILNFKRNRVTDCWYIDGEKNMSPTKKRYCL